MNRRIVITGPESTGKSTITAYLADRLILPAAQEYARIYLERNGPHYTFDSLLEMSRGHRQYQHEQVPAAEPLGLFDTDLTNYKIWSEVIFGKCHPEITETLQRENSHVYLLCRPDLPWEFDPLRENPLNREELFERHRQQIEQLRRPYRIISGTGTARFEAAEKAALELIGQI